MSAITPVLFATYTGSHKRIGEENSLRAQSIVGAALDKAWNTAQEAK